jgi:predicted aldo/keto reductase-like oxidoreductase
LETGEFDVVEVPCNVLDPWIFHEVFPVARKFDVGIIAMKVLAGGELSEQAGAALRFALGQPSDCFVVGMSTMEQVQTNVAETIAFERLDTEKQGQLVDEALYLGGALCRLKCDPCCIPLCPDTVPISDVLRLERFLAVYKSGHWAKEEYRRLGHPARLCSACPGYCLEGCTFELPVRKMLSSAHDRLSSPITDYEVAQHGGKGTVAKEIAA